MTERERADKAAVRAELAQIKLAAAQAAIQELVEFCHQAGVEIGDYPPINDRAALDAVIAEAEQRGFKRGVTFYERNQKTGEILVRYDEERK
jgi:hypothetical protein